MRTMNLCQRHRKTNLIWPLLRAEWHSLLNSNRKNDVSEITKTTLGWDIKILRVLIVLTPFELYWTIRKNVKEFQFISTNKAIGNISLIIIDSAAVIMHSLNRSSMNFYYDVVAFIAIQRSSDIKKNQHHSNSL